jgi:hypothetical protein
VTNDLVTRGYRIAEIRELRVEHVQVGATHPASQHAKQHFIGTRRRNGNLVE